MGAAEAMNPTDALTTKVRKLREMKAREDVARMKFELAMSDARNAFREATKAQEEAIRAGMELIKEMGQ